MEKMGRVILFAAAFLALSAAAWAEHDEVDSIRYQTRMGSDLLRVGEAGGKARALAGEEGCRRIQIDAVFNEQIPYNEGQGGFEYNITVYKGRVTKIERVGRGY